MSDNKYTKANTQKSKKPNMGSAKKSGVKSKKGK